MTITKQVETATVTGTITGTGNASVIVTARGMNGSPKTISVAVTDTDTASIVAAAIRLALATDADVAALFLTGGSGANITLTSHTYSANDSTLNISIDNDTCTGLTPALTSTNTTAGVGLDNAYCALTDVRNDDVVKISGTSHDELIIKVINGVSRHIDHFCARFFYVSSEVRYYTPKNSFCADVDDISSASGVTIETDNNGDGIFESAWTSTDYYLSGYNDLLKGFPFTKIETSPVTSFFFPTIRKSLKVTASFGWASVPDPVAVACILQSNRIWNRFKTPLGQVGTSTLGTMNLSIPKLDPDIEALLLPFRRLT